MEPVEEKMENLLHRVKILEQVYNDGVETIKRLEEELREERDFRKRFEVFVTEETEMRNKLEEYLKKDDTQRDELGKWLARFFGVVRIQHNGAEQSTGASSANPKDDHSDVEEDVSTVKIEPDVTDDAEDIFDAEDITDGVDAEDVTDYADAEMTDGSDVEDASSQKDFKMKSMETSFRQIRIQQEEGKRASSSATAQNDEAKKASAMKAIKVKLQPFSCNLCGKRFTLRMKCKSHMKRRHNWVEPTSKKQTSSTPSMKTVKCAHCSKLFASRVSMRKHIVVHTPAREALFHCPVAECDRYYRKLVNFDKHLEVRHWDCEFDFVCVHCRESPSFGENKEAYVSHMDSHHRSIPEAD